MQFYDSKFGTGQMFGPPLSARVDMDKSRDYCQRLEDAAYCIDAPREFPSGCAMIFESEGKMYYSQERYWRSE